jgi:hypothetical protein
MMASFLGHPVSCGYHASVLVTWLSEDRIRSIKSNTEPEILSADHPGIRFGLH